MDDKLCKDCQSELDARIASQKDTSLFIAGCGAAFMHIVGESDMFSTQWLLGVIAALSAFAIARYILFQEIK